MNTHKNILKCTPNSDKYNNSHFHIYKKYGTKHTAIAATVVTYRLKSAIREVGKALGALDGFVGAEKKTKRPE